MKTNFIVTLLALSPMFCYVVLSSCTPSTASYGPINRDAIGRHYSEAPVAKNDSLTFERARTIASTVLGVEVPDAVKKTDNN